MLFACSQVARNSADCEDPFDYIGSSASRSHSSSKRDLRQDDHFPRYHYYNCHASFMFLSIMSRCLPHVKYQPLNNAMKPSTVQPSKPLTGYVTACLTMLLALLVAGAVASM